MKQFMGHALKSIYSHINSDFVVDQYGRKTSFGGNLSYKFSTICAKRFEEISVAHIRFFPML
jgi:hypothetical protein